MPIYMQDSIRFCIFHSISKLMRFRPIVFFLFVFAIGNAQVKQDSLKQVLKTESNPSKKALIYSQLAKAYESVDIDSAFYYAETGLELSRSVSAKQATAENLAALADFHVIRNDLDSARDFYLESLDYFDPEEQLFDRAQIIMIVGNIELAQTRYIEALEYYQTSLDLAEDNNFQELIPHLYNNLGNLYLSIEDYEDATESLEMAYGLFSDLDDQYNAALVRSNLALIDSNTGELDQALEGYLESLGTFTRLQQWNGMASTYDAITRIYVEGEDLQSAHQYMELALNTLGTGESAYKGPTSRFRSSIYTTAGDLYMRMDSLDKAIKYSHMGLKEAQANSYLKDIYNNARTLGTIYDEQRVLDSALFYNKMFIEYYSQFESESDARRITQIKMQHQFDRLLREREVEEIKREEAYKRKELLYIGLTVLAVFTAVILWLLYANQKAKTARINLKKQNLELEKTALNQEITYKKKELASQMMYLIEKNEFINTIARKLIELKPNSKKEQQTIIQQLITELRSNSSNKVWKDFEYRFKEVNAEFYDKLNESYPDLTPNEVRLCAFLKLNMSTKEISSITHQSVKSINMARFRLRKKFDIERDENLISFLAQL